MKPTRSKTKRVDQSRLHESVALISRIASLCTADLSFHEALEEILDALRPVVPFDGATLYLFDERRTQLTAASSVGPELVDILGFLPLCQGKGLSGWVAEHDKPVLLADRSETGGFDPQHDFAAVASIPLRAGGNVVGVLNLGSRKAGGITDADIDRLSSISSLLGLAIECLTGYRTLHAMKEQLDRIKLEGSVPLASEPDTAHWAEARELCSTIHHEINDALAVIVGNAQCFLAEQTVLNQKVATRVRRIQEAAMRIRRVNQKLPSLGAVQAANGADDDTIT